MATKDLVAHSKTPEHSDRVRRSNKRRSLVYTALYDAATAQNCRKLREIATSILNKAIKGDMDAVNFVADRLDGRVKEVVQHEGGGAQIAFVIATADDLRDKIRGLPVSQIAPPTAVPDDDQDTEAQAEPAYLTPQSTMPE